jgi:hypothetical protein
MGRSTLWQPRFDPSLGQVHEGILRNLPAVHRHRLMQTNSHLWKRAIGFEAFHAEKELTASEAQAVTARSHADELNDTDLILLQSVMQLARDALRRFPLADLQKVADATAPGPLVRLAEEAVCSLLPVEAVKMWDRAQEWSIDGPAPVLTEWHLTFRRMLQEYKQAWRCLTGLNRVLHRMLACSALIEPLHPASAQQQPAPLESLPAVR